MRVRSVVNRIGTGFLLVLLGAVPAAALADTPAERLAASALVLEEVMANPDQGIPPALLAKAQCVVVVPGMKKGAFLVGGQYGRGFLTCRNKAGAGWGSPAAIRMEGGSFGFQIGATESDVILLVMDQKSLDSLLESKFTFGAGVEAVAGPTGRSLGAATDAGMAGRIFSYSRAKGVFAGAAAGGATIRQDLDENKQMYGRELTSREIVDGKAPAPKAAAELRALLARYSK